MAEDLLRRGGTEHQEEVSNSDAQQFQGLEGCAADAVARVLLPQPPCANAVVQLDDLPGMQERLSELTKGVTCGSIDHQAIVSFVDSARRANPAFEPDLDTTDALEGMSRVCSAFNRHICLPCRRVFVPSHLVSGHEPHFASADLVGSWQEHKAPIGENVWSSAIRLHSNALSPAFHVDGFCFWDIERLRVMSRSRFARLEPAKIPNAFDQALSSRYPSDNSDDFIQKLELPRAQNEEIHHAFDDSYFRLYKLQHPDMDDGDATVEAFLNPECARIRRAWQRVRTDPVKRLSLLSGIHELSARLGGTIQQMRDAISLRDYNFAWDIFLNFCGDQEYWRSGARQMYGPSVDLTSPFAGYMVCATEILDNVSTTDTSPEGILTVCADSDELRRCEKALALLEQSYTRVRSVPERRQLLSV